VLVAGVQLAFGSDLGRERERRVWWLKTCVAARFEQRLERFARERGEVSEVWKGSREGGDLASSVFRVGEGPPHLWRRASDLDGPQRRRSASRTRASRSRLLRV